MNIRALFRVAGLVLVLLPLAACNSDDGSNETVDDYVLTAEKYRLIGMAIRELTESGELPSGGRFVIADQTTMSDLAEDFMDTDETLDAASALDLAFPYDYLPWSEEESDMAFAGYYQANLEPVDVTLEGLETLEHDVSLLMHEQFDEYFASGDTFAGWDAFYIDFPDAAGYVRLGNPVLFEEAGFALVHVDFGCGALCGLGFYALFRIENGEWEFIDWVADWVS